MAATIGVLAEDRYLTQAQPLGVMGALAAIGVRVTLLGDAADASDCDLVVVRGRSDALLHRLALIEAAGVPTVNRRAAIGRVVDKSVMHVHLVDAGVPVPDTWTGSLHDVTRRVGHEPCPLVVKPVRGDNGRDVHVVRDGLALRTLAWHEPDVIVQRYLPNDGHDIKLYCAGDQVWAVRKPSPIRGAAAGADSATPIVTTDEHRDLARRCRSATGLDLYGIDCIDSDAGLVVIEVNDFPNYSGIPDVDRALAEHVLESTWAGVA